MDIDVHGIGRRNGSACKVVGMGVWRMGEWRMCRFVRAKLAYDLDSQLKILGRFAKETLLFSQSKSHI